ncbi:MAG: tyrosine-type recombinase/integrase, partial [Chloroflexi bacterium]|nr:tyrosine-type recombinase/integrase [Chloroflexota bacterium]
MADRQDPTKHRIVSQLVAASKKLSPPISHKEPATIAHLAWLARYATQTATFAARRTFQISLTLFASVSRLDDVIKLRIGHIKVHGDCVQLFLPRSKTDKQRDGDKKFMAPNPKATLCPVRNFRIWLARPEVGSDPLDAIFPRKSRASQPISPTTFRENLATALKGSGLPTITPHSLRAGGASALIVNGARIEDVQLMGGWLDPKSMQVYVKWSKEWRL